MKKVDIPQEENEALNGQKKVMYASNDEGKFQRFKYGSKVEEYATKVALSEYEELKKEALQKIQEGSSSCLEYFMYDNRMDLATLASITGLFQFRIKRHFKANIFKKLKDTILTKYANAFNITLEDIKEFECE